MEAQHGAPPAEPSGDIRYVQVSPDQTRTQAQRAQRGSLQAAQLAR
jgi:hypothetical protein